MNTTWYGLRLRETGELLGFTTSSNEGGEFCVGVAYELDHWGPGNLWLVKDRETAERVRDNSTQWFNAGYESPINPYIERKMELEVVEVTVTVA